MFDEQYPQFFDKEKRVVGSLPSVEAVVVLRNCAATIPSTNVVEDSPKQQSDLGINFFTIYQCTLNLSSIVALVTTESNLRKSSCHMTTPCYAKQKNY